MPYFLLFSTGSAVTSTALYLTGAYVTISSTGNFVCSLIGGIATTVGFAVWDSR
jgi:hypothetical protein